MNGLDPLSITRPAMNGAGSTLHYSLGKKSSDCVGKIRFIFQGHRVSLLASGGPRTTRSSRLLGPRMSSIPLLGNGGFLFFACKESELHDVFFFFFFFSLASEFCRESNNGLSQRLEQIQCALLDIGASVATPRATADPQRLGICPSVFFKRVVGLDFLVCIARTNFDPTGELPKTLEKWIDEMDDQLPPLKNFILPVGDSVFFHIFDVTLNPVAFIVRWACQLLPSYGKKSLPQGGATGGESSEREQRGPRCVGFPQ